MGIGHWLKRLFEDGPKAQPEIKVWQGRPPYEEVDALYQTENCAAHTFYVATKRPRGHGQWCSLGQEIKLIGINRHPDWARNLDLFFLGDKRWIVFKRDYENKYDAFAIEVYGVYTDKSTNKLERRRIGWVDSSISEYMATMTEGKAVIGTPKIFFYGEGTTGLRFRVWFDIEKERVDALSAHARLRDCLLREGGTSVAEAVKNTGFKSNQIRNWLEKLSKGDIYITAPLMVALSGYRVEKVKTGRGVTYKAIRDDAKIYKATGWTEEDSNEDPMGADVPGYLFDPI